MNQHEKSESDKSAVPVNESRRDLKRKRYETGDFGESYDSRYSSGLNELNTLVERRWIASHLKGNRILDAGAGTGRLSAYLAGQGFSVVALDNSRPMLETLRRKVPVACALRSRRGCDAFAPTVRAAATSTWRRASTVDLMRSRRRS